MATKDEKLTTRARANVIREFISNTKKDKNPFDHQEIFEILDLCLSCKGCKSECPSNVDMAKLKSEFLQHYYDQHGVPFRSLLIAHIHVINRFVQPFFGIYNYMSKTDFIRGLIHKMIGFAPQRTLPALHRITFRRWCQKELPKLNQKIINPVKSVYVFLDEFTEYNDVEIGIKTIKLLHRLNYKILTMDHEVSGRTYMSKGFVRKAKKIAQKNIEIFANVINENNPLIGIEPSAILSFRDEYPDLASGELKNEAKTVSKNSYLFEEFFVNEINQGNITKDSFDTSTVHILFHGHCQQKAVSSTESLNIMLNTPENYNAVEIKSGCCGMAGSFGYEKEHFELSNKVGELVLFPSVRNAKDNTIICASGTSCRHHILDGTGKKALHPVEVMYKALKSQV
jgi:Fe-S oxidoreductase